MLSSTHWFEKSLAHRQLAAVVFRIVTAGIWSHGGVAPPIMDLVDVAFAKEKVSIGIWYIVPA
jgi:hypothetical protein